MARNPHRSPKDFPQTEDSWLLTIRKLRLWITPKGKAPSRPFLILIVNHTRDLIQGSSIGAEPGLEKVRKVLFSAMTKPQKELGAPAGRPTRVIFEDADLRQALAPALQEIGVQAAYRPKMQELDGLVRDLETHMRAGQPEPPGLLSVKGASVKIVAALFNAAAEFYQAAPWVHLGNEDFLAVRVRPQENPDFVSIMGRGGVEYGLAVHKAWVDVERMYGPHDHPLEALPDAGAHSLLFNQITDVPFEDLEDIEKYGWSIAAPDAYPTPMIYPPSEQVRRPAVEEILWYEAVLHAIPEFVRDHLKRNSDGELEPVEANITVSTSAGSKSVEIRFPAGELCPGSAAAVDLLEEEDGGEQEEEDAEAVPFDRRVMEGTWRGSWAEWSQAASIQRSGRPRR